MEKLNKPINGRKQNIDIDIKNKTYIDNRYEFVPTNEIEFTAREIATKLRDELGIRFHIRTIKAIGVQKAREFCSLTLEDVKIAASKGKPINNPAALYNWKVQNYKRGRGIR